MLPGICISDFSLMLWWQELISWARGHIHLQILFPLASPSHPLHSHQHLGPLQGGRTCPSRLIFVTD